MPPPRFNHGFENDVFISYCWVDDKPDPSGRAWVSRFTKDLQILLQQNSGHTIHIWRDTKDLDTADRFDREIFDQLKKTAVLVPILSRNYLTSEYCNRELYEFANLANDLGNTTRVVKVAKTYVPIEEYSPELRETNQHDFFVQDEKGQYRQYHLHPDPRYEREYAAHVDDVAQEIERILRRLQGGSAPRFAKGAVYVGETSSDLNVERDRLRRMFLQMGYEVLPQTRLYGMRGPEVRRTVQRDLALCRLAILPVGAYYGPVPEMANEASVIKLQLEMAATDRRSTDFPRLIWIPRGTRSAEPRQEEFLKDLRENWSQHTLEVLEVSPHQLQEVLQTRLTLHKPSVAVDLEPSQIWTAKRTISSGVVSAPAKAPYLGLRSFSENDVDLFFGRDEQVSELLTIMHEVRFMTVLGSSGSGKSSLVSAGLIPALRAGRVTAAGSRWRVIRTTPGDDPIGNLASQLAGKRALGPADWNPVLRRGSLGLVQAVQQAHLNLNENVLVIVDQFEELFRWLLAVSKDNFSAVKAEEESAAYVKLLLDAAEQRETQIYVVITMRSDFLGECSRFHNFSERINHGLYLMPRLGRDQIEQAIVGPIGVAGADIAPRLVQQILNEIGDDQDQLPVLQHALLRMWNQRTETDCLDLKEMC